MATATGATQTQQQPTYTTFKTLQQQGVARPPSPSYQPSAPSTSYAPTPASTTPGTATKQQTAQQAGYDNNPQTGQQAWQAQAANQPTQTLYQANPGVMQPTTGSTPPSTAGASGQGTLFQSNPTVVQPINQYQVPTSNQQAAQNSSSPNPNQNAAQYYQSQTGQPISQTQGSQVNYQNPASWSGVGQQLYNTWNQGQSQAPAQFTPGANPFTSQQMGQMLGQQYLNSGNAQQFNPNTVYQNPFFQQQMQQQYQGYQGNPMFQGGAPNPLTQGIEANLQGLLQNPSAYSSAMVKGTYDMLNQQMSQDFDYQRKQMTDAMARRGIDASTITGQHYADLGTEQARAQQNLAYQLLTDQAKQYGTDMNNALASAMGYDNQRFGQQLAGYQTNLAANNQNFAQQQQLLGNVLDYGQQQYSQGANTFGLNQNAQQQAFNQQQQNLQNLQNYGNTQYDQSANTFALNQQAQQQQYAQQQQNLMNLLGFGQQEFQNQMAVNQFNADQNNVLNQFLLSLMGGVG